MTRAVVVSSEVVLWDYWMHKVNAFQKVNMCGRTAESSQGVEVRGISKCWLGMEEGKKRRKVKVRKEEIDFLFSSTL